MPHTLCYNIPSYKVDTKSIGLLEMFIDEWLDRTCVDPYKFRITERFFGEEVRLEVFLGHEDAFYIKMEDLPEQLPAFRAII